MCRISFQIIQLRSNHPPVVAPPDRTKGIENGMENTTPLSVPFNTLQIIRSSLCPTLPWRGGVVGLVEETFYLNHANRLQLKKTPITNRQKLDRRGLRFSTPGHSLHSHGSDTEITHSRVMGQGRPKPVPDIHQTQRVFTGGGF